MPDTPPNDIPADPNDPAHGDGAEIPAEEPLELIEFLEDDEEPVQSSDRTEESDILVSDEDMEEFTWAELALDEPAEEPVYHAEKTQMFDLEDDIFTGGRTELDIPASAVNIAEPGVPATLRGNEEDSDGEVSIDLAPPQEEDDHEPLTAAKLYDSGDSQEQPKPQSEPIEFGNGAEEIDFDILHAGDSPSSRFPFSQMPTDGSAVQLGMPPSAVDSESSIFRDDPDVLPTSPGSGWLDSMRSSVRVPGMDGGSPSSGTVVGKPEPPRGGSSVADLFGMLAHGPSTPNVPIGSGWVKEEHTGHVSESEVLKAFDQLAKAAPTDRVPMPPSPASDALSSSPGSKTNPDAGPSFDSLDAEGSNLFPQPEEYHIEMASDGPSGVDILDPHGTNDTGSSRSSIFSQPGNRNQNVTEQITFDDPLEAEGGESSLFDAPPIVGSSIFQKGRPESNWGDENEELTAEESKLFDDQDLSGRALASHAVIEAGVDWDEVDHGHDQVSMRMPRPDDSYEELDELFFPSGPTSPSVVAEHEIPPPDSASNFVSAPMSAADSGIIRGDQLDEDEPVGLMPTTPSTKKDAKSKQKAEPKPKAERPAKRKGSMAGFIGGGIAGVLLGAGGLAGAYYGGLLTDVIGESGKAPVAPVVQADPKVAEELKAALTKAADTEKKAQEDLKAATLEAEKAQEALRQAKTDAEDAKEAAAKAATDLKTAMTAAIKAKEDLKAAMLDAGKAQDDAKLAKADTEKAVKDYTDSKKMLDDKVKALTEAETAAADAEKKRKAADDTLAAMVKEFKTNKLIPEEDEPAAALAKLPEILKSAALAMTSADAKKAAEALMQAKKDLDAAKLAATKAEDAVVTAKAEAKDAMTAAEKAKTDAAKMVADIKKETDDKVMAAVEKTAMMSKKQLDDAMAAAAAAETKLKAEAAAHAAQMKVIADEQAKQLLEARAGSGIRLTAPEALRLDHARAAYDKGVNAYFDKRLADAEKTLFAATEEVSTDARFWYYLGLAQYRQGKAAAAEASFKKGAEMEKRNLPDRATINEDMQRIQGPLRTELAKYRP